MYHFKIKTTWGREYDFFRYDSGDEELINSSKDIIPLSKTDMLNSNDIVEIIFSTEVLNDKEKIKQYIRRLYSAASESYSPIYDVLDMIKELNNPKYKRKPKKDLPK